MTLHARQSIEVVDQQVAARAVRGQDKHRLVGRVRLRPPLTLQVQLVFEALPLDLELRGVRSLARGTRWNGGQSVGWHASGPPVLTAIRPDGHVNNIGGAAIRLKLTLADREF